MIEILCAFAQSQNAEEARQWIENWRARNKGGASSSSNPRASTSSTPGPSGRTGGGSVGSGASSGNSSIPQQQQQQGEGKWFSGFKLPWQQQEQQQQQQSGQVRGEKSTGEISENVKEAKEWIRAWRARSAHQPAALHVHVYISM